MTQCKLKKKKALNDNKQVRLENLGVVWDNDHRWEINFNLLKQFKFKNGHCDVLQKYEVDGVKLGLWLNTQRKKKKKKTLKDRRRELLENLGVVWVLKKVNVESN